MSEVAAQGDMSMNVDTALPLTLLLSLNYCKFNLKRHLDKKNQISWTNTPVNAFLTS